MRVMNDFLPSRKVIAFVLVPVLTVFLLWVIVRYYEEPAVVSQERSSLEVALEEGEQLFQEQDTDGDGLKDWEEFLYQTDERNTDTDGDGQSDGLEVRRGFDPLVAGDGTETGVEPENQSGITFYKNDPNLTKTDLLARDIFVVFAELKNGDALDLEGVRDSAIEKAIQDNTGLDSALVYTLDDVTAVPDSRSAARSYYTSYRAATQTLIGIQFSEIDLFSRYVRDGDESALIELQKNKENYDAFVAEINKISPPETIKVIHVELLNNVSIIASTIENMLLVREDPLLALVAAQKFLEDEELLEKNTEAILLYFTNNGL